MSLTLGIDIGTSGIRSAVIDNMGKVISMARASHLPQKQNHIDATLWWEATVTCIRAQVENLKSEGYDPSLISKMAVDGTSGTMVLVDKTLCPVTRALMYNSKGFDKEADLIGKVAPNNHVTLGAASALGRAMHLAKELDGRQPEHLLHQADFIAAKLVGTGGISDYNNAYKTGFDPETKTWPDWIGTVFDPGLLPNPLAPGTPIGEISASVAIEVNLPATCIIHAGTTDSTAAFFACAPLTPGVAVTSLGSTLAIKILSEIRIDDPVTGLYSHRVGDFWLAGGASNTGGAVLAHYFSGEELQMLSTKIDPEVKSELDYYPLLEPGERFPINDPDLPPRLLPRPKSDVAFLHGMLESMAKIEERCYRTVEAKGGIYPKTLFTAGGGANNPVWSAIRNRVLGVTPQKSRHSEAAIGVAKLAL